MLPDDPIQGAKMAEGEVPAGWYPDPENPGRQRYWDGAAWGPAAPAGYAPGPVPAAAVPPGMYFDPVSGLLLPNGVQLASIGRRIGAWFLAIPLAIVTLGIGYVVWGLIVWGRGQTPALQVLGMRCWRPETNRVATWGWMALRDVIGRIVEGLLSIITLLVSFILMCTGKERKTIHDHIAGTVVLHDPNHVLPS
jgi:uncharacterized RDD family membrane protein YckC